MNQKNNINYDYDSNLADKAGGNSQEWKKEKKIGLFLDDYTPLSGMDMEEYLNVVLSKINRIDFPITLNPNTASFIDVAIHAVLRQRLKKSTVISRIRYARFMESHKVPVDFRNPTYEKFIRHMDYREQIENAGYGAMGQEWKTMKMFLNAYGLPIWDYRPPSGPRYIAKIYPFPDQVYKIINLDFSNDPYENALIQYLLTHNFVIGWRVPSEPAIMKTSDVCFDQGEIIITEPKKNHSTRTIDPTEIMTNPRRKSLKNWIDSWRPKVENQYSKDYIYLRPDGRPFNKENLRMFLNRKAAPLARQIFPRYHNYISRDFAAIGRLIRAKIQTGKFDEYEVKEFLGHDDIRTTEHYTKDAKRYYLKAPYDWVYRVLKAQKYTGGDNAIIAEKIKRPRFLALLTDFSPRESYEPTGDRTSQREENTPERPSILGLLIFYVEIDSILIKTFFLFFYNPLILSPSIYYIGKEG